MLYFYEASQEKRKEVLDRSVNLTFRYIPVDGVLSLHNSIISDYGNHISIAELEIGYHMYRHK